MNETSSNHVRYYQTDDMLLPLCHRFIFVSKQTTRFLVYLDMYSQLSTFESLCNDLLVGRASTWQALFQHLGGFTMMAGIAIISHWLP